MKKLIVLAISAMTVTCLCACGGGTQASSTASGASGDTASTPEFATLGEALSAENTEHQAQWNDDQYVYVYQNGDQAYRVVAEMTPEVAEALEKVEFGEDGADEKVLEVLKDQKVTKVEDLTQGIPAQEELDKMIGKTGKELVLDEGYELVGNSYFDNTVQGTFSKGLYTYTAEMNEQPKNPDNFNGDVEILDMTVKSFTYAGISDMATDINNEV